MFVAGVVGFALAANGLVAVGFNKRNIEAKIGSLMEENKKLELQATNLKSLQLLSESPTAKNLLVPVSGLKHILFTGQPRESSVGQK